MEEQSAYPKASLFSKLFGSLSDIRSTVREVAMISSCWWMRCSQIVGISITIWGSWRRGRNSYKKRKLMVIGKIRAKCRKLRKIWKICSNSSICSSGTMKENMSIRKDPGISSGANLAISRSTPAWKAITPSWRIIVLQKRIDHLWVRASYSSLKSWTNLL